MTRRTSWVFVSLGLLAVMCAVPALAQGGVELAVESQAAVADAGQGELPGACGGSSQVQGESGGQVQVDLDEVLHGFDPVETAPPWGCTTWGICSQDCSTSCFYNEDCPLYDGFRQVCICSGWCP